jgi:hypothetical protein
VTTKKSNYEASDEDRAIVEVDFRVLKSQPDIALAIGWLLAQNDVESVVYLQDLIEADKTHYEGLRKGTANYLHRIGCGHIREAFKLIEPTSESEALMSFINAEEAAKASFEKLRAIYNSDQFKLYKRIRDNAFHYPNQSDEDKLSKWIVRTIQYLVKNKHKKGSVVSAASGQRKLGRYDFVDVIFDNLFERHILQLRESDRVVDSDKSKKVLQRILGPLNDVMQVSDAISLGLIAGSNRNLRDRIKKMRQRASR